MAKADLTAQRLRELLHYDPETGVFTWLVNRRGFGGAAKAGRAAGAAHGSGYLRIGLDGCDYFAHRLVWFYTYGNWPIEQIDHIDGDRQNNRIENLRDVSHSTNNENRRISRVPGRLLGVTFNKANRIWVAQISVQGQAVHIGCFETQELAHAAYIERKRQLHTGCAF